VAALCPKLCHLKDKDATQFTVLMEKYIKEERGVSMNIKK
jgi:hypothetical protein